MLQYVKCFFKVKLNEYEFLRRLIALVNEFICPCKAVLNTSVVEEPTLIGMYHFEDDFLKPVSQKFCDDLERTIEQ